MSRRRIGIGGSDLRRIVCLLSISSVALASIAASRHAAAPRSASAAKRDVVIYQVHSIRGAGAPDTIVMYVTPALVRVSQRAGDAILDVKGDRLVLVDRASRTYRATSLATWESRIAAALDSTYRGSDSTAAADAPAEFELAGPGGEIAGARCDRYHLFAKRELFPGEVEMVEQEIWVAPQLELPAGAYQAYARAVENLDSIGLPGHVRRPPGVMLRMETHTQSARGGSSPAPEEMETTEVVRIERRPLPKSLFEIPAGYTPADSS